MSSGPAIEVNGLGKVYRDGLLGRRRVTALDGVSFQVRRGEIFGLLGPNGAGKTTLIKVLLGIVSRTGGDARLLGFPAGHREGRRRTGFLPENHRIPRHHTGDSALAYYGMLSGLSSARIKERRPVLLETVGLREWGRTSIKKYSKGMLQRLGLAQALMHEPDLLILDEPTDGVDPVGRSEMRTLLQRLKGEGKTIFINSHLLQEIELVCDRVVILNKGHVLREASIDELTIHEDTELVIRVQGDEAVIRGALEGAAAIEPAGERTFEAKLHIAGQAEVDRCVDRLRTAGLSIVSMTPRRISLEEAFLQVLAEKGTES